jgi:hypothetical protein
MSNREGRKYHESNYRRPRSARAEDRATAISKKKKTEKRSLNLKYLNTISKTKTQMHVWVS